MNYIIIHILVSQLYTHYAFDTCPQISVSLHNRMDVSSILGNPEIKQYIKNAAYPLVSMLYNEIYIYIWFICIYNVFLLSLILTNLFLLIRYMRFSESSSDKMSADPDSV